MKVLPLCRRQWFKGICILTTHSMWGFSELFDGPGWSWGLELDEQSPKLLATLLPSLTDPFPGVVGVCGGCAIELGSGFRDPCAEDGWSCDVGGWGTEDPCWGPILGWWDKVVIGSIGGWGRGGNPLTSSVGVCVEWSCQLLSTIAILDGHTLNIENSRKILREIVKCKSADTCWK